MKIKNVHERTARVAVERAREMLDSLATRGDELWPRHSWPPMRLDAPKDRNGRGGHGPIRYRVIEYAPGRKIVFEFEQRALSRGLYGVHYFELDEHADGQVTARHTIDVRLGWPAILLWPILIRPLHDALIEDALDNFERAAGFASARRSDYNTYVSCLRALIARRPSAAGRRL